MQTTYTLNDLPPLIEGRSGLRAIPRMDFRIPCVRVTGPYEADCVEDGRRTGRYVLNGGDWHFMPGLGIHFGLNPGLVYNPFTSNWQIGTEVSATYRLLAGDPSNSLDLALRAFWAGGREVVKPFTAIRQKPAVVVGQVAGATFCEGQLLKLNLGSHSWRELYKGDFIVCEPDGTNVRTLSYSHMTREFLRFEDNQGNTVVDFDTLQDPPIEAH